MPIIMLIRKNGGKYLFRYDESESEQKLQETLGQFASDPELDFTWYDAAIISNKARDLAKAKDPIKASRMKRNNG